MLEIELETNNSGLLKLKQMDRRSCTKKHFIYLLSGIWDLCLDGEVLLILGPTMDLDGRLGSSSAKWR